MIIFLDTSALFKLYHQEEGTDNLVRFILEKKVTIIYLSEIAKIEFASSIWKKVRTKEIVKSQAELTLAMFQEDLKKYKLVTTDSLILELAEKLIAKYNIEGLRALDSIQLASCISLKGRIDFFITSDKLLRELMIKEELKVDL